MSQRFPVRTMNGARHNDILRFPVKWFGIPGIILVIGGADSEDALVDPKMTQLG